jgi:hypothetical protein
MVLIPKAAGISAPSALGISTMRPIIRIAAAAILCLTHAGLSAVAEETPAGEKNSVTSLRTANRLQATDIYDEALIKLVGRSALLHDLGELDAFAGQVSTFQLEEVPPGFAISLLVSSQPGDGKLTPDSSIRAADVSITLEESESGRPGRRFEGVHQTGWNFPVATKVNAIDYPFLLTREGATYAIKLDGKRLEASDHKLHFVLILTPVVPGGLAAGENSSE